MRSSSDSPPLTRRSQTTAQGVVASLTLPPPRPAPFERPSPLPPIGLHHPLPRDASMVYDIGRVDSSGRVASIDIVNALNWHPGTKLEVILAPKSIVIRSAPDGRFSVPRGQRIIIPSRARRPHCIVPGDRVLIAAAPDHGLLIVYPLSALDEMISRYHSPHAS